MSSVRQDVTSILDKAEATADTLVRQLMRAQRVEHGSTPASPLLAKMEQMRHDAQSLSERIEELRRFVLSQHEEEREQDEIRRLQAGREEEMEEIFL